jgi:hypothetical protein
MSLNNSSTSDNNWDQIISYRDIPYSFLGPFIVELDNESISHDSIASMEYFQARYQWYIAWITEEPDDTDKLEKYTMVREIIKDVNSWKITVRDAMIYFEAIDNDAIDHTYEHKIRVWTIVDEGYDNRIWTKDYIFSLLGVTSDKIDINRKRLLSDIEDWDTEWEYWKSILSDLKRRYNDSISNNTFDKVYMWILKSIENWELSLWEWCSTLDIAFWELDVTRNSWEGKNERVIRSKEISAALITRLRSWIIYTLTKNPPH